MPASAERVMNATDFKARCLEIFDQLAARKLRRVVITKRGRTVAVLTPPDPQTEIASLYGFMEGSVIIPEGVDVTAPALDEPLNAEQGRIHE